MTSFVVIVAYLSLLLILGFFSSRFFRGTSKDYFVASHSIGPFLLLMSVFGTTMTAFALVGSTGKAFERGIGVYGLMASSSALVHAAVFFWVGIKLWAIGKRHGYVTQIQFFRARFESNGLGYLLFPILVGLVIPYLLIGVMGAAKVILPATAGAFPQAFPNEGTPFAGGIPFWLTGLGVCAVVLSYIFAGGSRATAWANTFQTLFFMGMGLVAFCAIAHGLGGLRAASRVPLTVTPAGEVVQTHRIDPETHAVVERESPLKVGRLVHPDPPAQAVQPHLSRRRYAVTFERTDPQSGEAVLLTREIGVPPLMFLTYFLIPLSVGMFPHIFQHWLTARSAGSFRLTVVAHPICIMIVWVPCVLIGVWASGLLPPTLSTSAVLSVMLQQLVGNPILGGLLTAGVLAAIMSSLDSQFLCMGTIFTNDIVLHRAPQDRFSDRQIIFMSRAFIVGIVTITYALAMLALAKNVNIFDLAVWSFSGFTSLFPLIVAALYWKRATRAGAYASVVAAMVVWFYYFWRSGFGGEYTVSVGSWRGIMPVTLSFAASALMLVLVSLGTRPPSQATINRFFFEHSMGLSATGDGNEE